MRRSFPTTTPGGPRSSPSSPAKVFPSRPSSPVPTRRLKAPRPSPPGGSPAGTGPTSGWPNDRRPGPRDRRDRPPKRHGTPGTCSRPLRDRHPSSPRQKCERPREETEMPVAYVDIPTGRNDGAKKKIFQELYEEIHEAWPIPDTRVLIREWPNEAVSQDGRIENVPMRPICTLAVPPGLEHDAKQRLVRQISNTIGEACGREVEEIRLPSGTKIYNNWVLTFFWELPLDKVALGDLTATENPLVLENLPPQ